jgi:hypothetical protein
VSRRRSLLTPILQPILSPDFRAISDPGVGGGAWSPLALFLPGNVGYAYDFTSASLNYQENTRTNLVTTPGHSIGSATDLSGLGNHASQATSAQRPAYQGTCRFVGADDSLATPSVDFTGTNKVTVLIKLKSNSSGTVQIPLELSSSAASNSGSFSLEAPNTTTNRYAVGVRGSATYCEVRLPGQVAPVTNVIVAQLDSSQATVLGQISATISPSGGAATTNGTASVAANFGNHISYIGRRAGASAPFNGDIDRIIVIGRALTAPELAAATTWIASSSAPALHGAITDRVVVARRGDQLLIRTKWDSDTDLIQSVSMKSGVSAVPDMVSFMGARLVPNSEIDALAGFNAASGANIIGAQGDDATPFLINGTFIGANHGCDRLRRVPATAHGKTVEDIGSVWTDSLARRWVLMAIVSANVLDFISENQSVAPEWSFHTTLSGTTLTHASGALHTGAIAITSAVTGYQLYPAVNNIVKAVRLDGITDITAGPDSIYTCDFLDIEHDYGVTNVGEVVEFAKARAGGAVAPDYSDDSIPVDLSASIRYRFTPKHACAVEQSATAQRNLSFGYIGFMQAVKLSITGTDTLWTYVPRLNPITVGANTYDLSAQHNMAGFADNVYFTTPTWADANNPPSSMTQMVKNSGGTKLHSFTMGYTPDRFIGVPALRKTLVGEAGRLASTSKHYLEGLESTGSAFPGGILPEDVEYSVVGYRAFTNNADDFPHGPEGCWYLDGDDVIVVLDFDTTQSNYTFPLPAWMDGKVATVIESDAFTLHSATASSGITVSSTAGRGIVRLT